MLSLPLAKLSSAQDAAPEENKFSWSHETHNLVVVIDTYGASGPPSQLLKVVQGTQVRVRASASPSLEHTCLTDTIISEANMPLALYRN